MITKQEYIDALKIVARFEIQEEAVRFEKIISLDEVSTRLYNLLTVYTGKKEITSSDIKIDKRSFMRIRNAGKKGWDELEALQKKYEL